MRLTATYVKNYAYNLYLKSESRTRTLYELELNVHQLHEHASNVTATRTLWIEQLAEKDNGYSDGDGPDAPVEYPDESQYPVGAAENQGSNCATIWLDDAAEDLS